MGRVRMEFTVEPFVDNHPGAHVQAVWQAAEARGCEVVHGPFSTETWAATAEAPEVIADLVRAALAAGATFVAFQVERLGPPPVDDVTDDDADEAGDE